MKSNSYSFIENYFIKSRDFREIREIRLFRYYWEKLSGETSSLSWLSVKVFSNNSGKDRFRGFRGNNKDFLIISAISAKSVFSTIIGEKLSGETSSLSWLSVKVFSNNSGKDGFRGFRGNNKI